MTLMSMSGFLSNTSTKAEAGSLMTTESVMALQQTVLNGFARPEKALRTVIYFSLNRSYVA